MKVHLYNSPGERNLLSRTMTLIASKTAVNTTEVVNIETPDLLIDYAAGYLATNYVYVEEYGRYYFVNDISIVNGNQIRLQLESDPLYSFRSSILGSPCIAKRSTSQPNPGIEDNLSNFKPEPKRIYRHMPGGFSPASSGYTYILTLGGK